MSEIFFSSNALAAFFGWLAFNFITFSSFKDENEKTFNLKSYYLEHWDNWVGSFISIPAFLWLGSKGFGFTEIGAEGLKWSDAYYVASGFHLKRPRLRGKSGRINERDNRSLR